MCELDHHFLIFGRLHESFIPIHGAVCCRQKGRALRTALPFLSVARCLLNHMAANGATEAFRFISARTFAYSRNMETIGPSLPNFTNRLIAPQLIAHLPTFLLTYLSSQFSTSNQLLQLYTI